MGFHLEVNRTHELLHTHRCEGVGLAIGMGLLGIFFGLLLLTPLPCAAISYDPGIALSASDDEPFGERIAISGDFSLIGTPSHVSPPDTLASGAAYIIEHREGSAPVEHKIVPADIALADNFGSSVAIDGDIAVVGAPADDDRGSNSGSVYVYRYDGASWNLDQKLTADDGVAYDGFGASVAISGDAILVASPVSNYSGDDDPGAAYVFRYNGSDWVEEDKFSSSDAAAQDDFGAFGVALSGEVAVVGVPGADAENDLGKIYVFRNDGVGNWSEEDKLATPADSAQASWGASFGEVLAVSGDALLVGAYRGNDDNGDRVGTAYVYRYDGVDSWDFEVKLDGEGESYSSHFGHSVALSGDTAVIGTNAGWMAEYAAAVHVFWYDGISWVEQERLEGSFGKGVALTGATALVGYGTGEVYLFRNIPDIKLIATDGAQADNFGQFVALSGYTALVGAPGDDHQGASSGSAHLFWYDGANWIDEDKLSAADGAAGRRFGNPVALDGDTAVAGAWGDTDSSGLAYAFRYSEGSWGVGTKLTAPNGAADDQFGRALAVSGDRIVVGAPNDGWTGSEQEYVPGPGAAYVFQYSGGSWGSGIKITAEGGEPADNFGYSVAIRGDTIVVGAPTVSEGGSPPGAAYVFRYEEGSWNQDPALSASESAPDDGFGLSVALSSDTIAVGANDAAYVFGDNGETSVQEDKLTASGGTPQYSFGRSIDISSENTIVVGVEIDESLIGAAYVYWHDGESWVEAPKFIGFDTETWDFYGTSVSISDDVILVGAPNNDDQGAAYVHSVRYEAVPEPSLLVLHLTSLGALACIARWRVLS